MEMQIDAYFYESKNHKKFKNFKIHKHLVTKDKLSKELIDLLNKTYKETHNIDNGGKKYQIGQRNMYYSYKFLVEDSTGIKTKLYKMIDFFTPKKEGVFASYSSHITHIDDTIFNNEHQVW